MELPVILFIGGLLVTLWLVLWTAQRRRLDDSTAPDAAEGVSTGITPLTRTGELPLTASGDAVLIANARGQLVDVNDTARLWVGVKDLDIDLELFARLAQPADSFLHLFAEPGAASFKLANRWVEGVSYRSRSGASSQMVVILREPTGERDGSALDLSRAIRVNNELSETINATLGVDQVLQTLLTIMRKALPFDAGEINLYDPQSGLLAPRGWLGDVSYVLALAEAGGVYTAKDGITGWLTQYRKPIVIADSRADDAVRPKLPTSPYRSYVGVPLTIGDRYLGTFELAAINKGQFTAGDLGLLQAIAAQMATAIYNAELYAAQVRRIQDLASLQEVTNAASPDDLNAYSEAVYTELTQRVARLMDSDICGVLLYDERKQALVAELPFYGLSPFVARNYSIPAAETTHGYAVWQQSDVWIGNDLADEPLTEPLGLSLLVNAAGVYNTILLPLQAGTRRIGLLQVCNRQGRTTYTSRDGQNLRLLGAQVAVVVEELRVARDEQRRDTEMIGVQAITQAFGAIAHADEFFASANERIAQIMGIGMCGILLYDEAAQRLVAQPPFYGLDDSVVKLYGIDVPPGSIMADIWENEDYWFTNNAPTDKITANAGLADLAVALGVNKTLIAVLSSGGQRIGAVQVSNKLNGEDFTDRDARLLLIFAAQVAAMIDNARLFRETQRRAEEAELLRSIAEEAGRILTNDDSFVPTLQQVTRLLRAEAVFVTVLDRQTGSLITYPRHVYGIELDRAITQSGFASGFDDTVAMARLPLLTNAARSDRRIAASYAALSRELKIDKAVIVPLEVGDSGLGEMGVINRVDEFSEEDVRLLAVVAIQIAAALDRIRLYEESGENLRRRLGELDAIQRVSNEVAQTLDVDRVLEVIRTEAVRATETDGSSIALLLPVIEWRTPEQPTLARRLGDRLPVEGLADIEREAVRQPNTAVLVTDYTSSPLVPHQAIIRSAVAVAFTHEDQPIGVIHLYHPQAEHFDRRAAVFLETLAAKASVSYASSLRFEESRDRSERLRRRVEQLNQIFELSQMLQTSVDPVTMLEAIAYSVQQSCGYDTVVMTLADEDTGVLRRVAQAGMPVEKFEATKHKIIPLSTIETLFSKDEFRASESLLLPFDRVSRWMIDGLDALATTFDSQRTLNPSRRDDWRDGDMLLVPIPGSQGHILGVMSLDRPQDGKRPDRMSVEVVEIFAHQAASIIENTRMYSTTQRQAEQEAQLNTLMEAIASTLDADEIILSVARGALRVLPFKRMTLALLDLERQGFDMVRVDVAPDQTLTSERIHTGSLVDTAIGRTYSEATDYLYHLDEATAAQYIDLAEAYQAGERTSLIVPLITGGLVLGALHFGADLINAYGFEEFRPLIKRIANLSAVAFGNASLFADAQTRTQRLALLNNVSILLAQSLDIENILETAVREIAVLLSAPMARGYIFDRGEVNVARLIVEYPRGEFPPEAVLDLNSRAAFRKVSHTALPDPIIVPDRDALAPDDPIRIDMEAAGQIAYVLIPMAIGGQANGAIELEVYDAPRDFDPEKLDLALVIGNQAAIAVLNANLLEQTLVRTRELETLLEAAQATSTSVDLDEVFQSVSRLTIQALDMDECAIMMYDNVRDELVITLDISRTGDEDRLMSPGMRIALADQPGMAKTLTSGQIQILRAGHAGIDPVDVASMQAVGDAARMYIPLMVGNQPIGLLQAASGDTRRAFSHRELRMAQALGAQAATSIENARLTTETAAQVEQSMLINELSREISSTMDIETMLRIVADGVPRLTNAAEMYLALYDADSGTISFPMAMQRRKPFLIPPRPLGSDEVSFVIRHRRPLTLGGENPSADEMRRNLGINSTEGPITRYMGMPLVVGDQVLGVLAVREQGETRPFGLNEQRILQTIAAQLGAAIQNANLFERVRHFADELNQRVTERTVELQTERDRLNTLYQITSELGRSLELETVLNRALNTVGTSISAESGVVLLIDPETDRLYPRAALNRTALLAATNEAAIITGEAIPIIEVDHQLAESLADRLLNHSENRAIVIDDLRTEPLNDGGIDGSLIASVTPEEWRSALAVVLETNEEVQGVLVFLARRAGVFGEAQMRLVSAAASQISAAINNAALYRVISDQAERMSTLYRTVQEEAEKNSSILIGIADGVILTDADGMIVVCNPAAERILGLKRDRVLGQPLAKLPTILGQSNLWMRTLNAWIANPDRDEDDELLVDRIEVDERMISLRASSVAIGEQSFGIVAVIRDITRDVEVDRMKSDFIANVSHELRTPMTSIKGYADLLLMGGGGPVTEDQERFLQTIKINADRLADLVNDILNISRIDAGVGLVLGEVDLGSILRETVATLVSRDRNVSKQLAVTTTVDPSLPRIHADPTKVAQIAANIIDNAFNYTPAGGSVRIDAHRNPDDPASVLITVADTGIGIAEHMRERVWERFERDDDSALVMDVSGTGLGLNIVKTFVEMHEGRVWFDSTLGVGTTFYITLPIAGPNVVYPLPAGNEAASGVATAPPTGD